MTARTASSAGLKLAYPTPRILITSFESAEGGETSVSLDLRLDEVEVAGGTDGTRRLFQYARGTAESHLEQQVVGTVFKRSAVTTATVMAAAAAGGIKLLVLDRNHPSPPAPVSARARELIKTALAAGRQIVIPAQAVTLSGKPRWGWWDIHPRTGRTIGVMESGQHQGFVEYSTTTEEVPLNSEMGFVLGLLVGANYTALTLSSAILAIGELTDEVLEQIQKSLEEAVCLLCPPAQAEAKSEIKVGGDCLKFEIASAGKKFEFCDRYADGFKCAVGMLINSHRGKTWGVEIEHGGEVKLACDQAEAKHSVSSGGD